MNSAFPRVRCGSPPEEIVPARPAEPRLYARCVGDRGEVASNTAIFGLVALVVFVCIQVGLWFHARGVAGSAAQHAVDAARVETGSAAAGEEAFNQYVGQIKGLDQASVTVTRSDEVVTVTVTGTAASIVGFLDPPINVTVEAPVERVVE